MRDFLSFRKDAVPQHDRLTREVSRRSTRKGVSFGQFRPSLLSTPLVTSVPRDHGTRVKLGLPPEVLLSKDAGITWGIIYGRRRLLKWPDQLPEWFPFAGTPRKLEALDESPSPPWHLRRVSVQSLKSRRAWWPCPPPLEDKDVERISSCPGVTSDELTLDRQWLSVLPALSKATSGLFTAVFLRFRPDK
jgi:hypothetical protein